MKRDELAKAYQQRYGADNDWGVEHEAKAFSAGWDACLETALGELRENYINGGKGMADWLEERLK